MLYASLKTLHVLSIIVWVGGMAFTLFFLRPALATLELPVRVQLMHEVLRKFFKAVLVMALVALLSGVGMMLLYSSQALQAGGNARMPWTWSVMAGLGVLMILIFGHIRFVLFRRLGQALASHAWTSGGAAMASIRIWVRANLLLGLLIVVLVIGAR